MNPAIYAMRREKLRYSLQEKGLDALIVSHAANRFYLSGFELHDPQCNETAGWLFITAKGKDWLLTDPRYYDAAKRLWDEEYIHISSGVEREKQRTFLKNASGAAQARVGFESKSMNVDTYDFLRQELFLHPTRGMIERHRVIKDSDEMACMERSIKVNHMVCERVPEVLVPGRTEAEVAWEIEKLFRELGASELSFASIVAVGPNAALPHAIPGETQIREGDMVLVDIGGRVDNYCSDQTRTFWVGDKPSDRFLKTRDMVQEAQNKAIEAARPGMRIMDLYGVARDSFVSHGVESRFTHALGHGIGLETHEPPSLGPRTESELKPGMVVTVEPGLYDPEWGGIRWEYMIEITEDGARVL